MLIKALADNAELVENYIQAPKGKFKGFETTVTFKLPSLKIFPESSNVTLISDKSLSDTDLIIVDSNDEFYEFNTGTGPTGTDDSDVINTDPFGNSSLLAQFLFDGDYADNSSQVMSSNDGSLSFDSDGKYGQCLVVDNSSVSDYTVEFDAGLDNTLVDTLTVGFWFNLQSTPTSTSIPIASNDYITDADPNNTFRIEIDSNNRIHFVLHVSDKDYRTVGAPLEVGKWYYVILAHSRIRGSHFLVFNEDNKLVTNAFELGTRNIKLKNSVSIGKPASAPSNCKIDQLEIFNTYPTLLQIKTKLLDRYIKYSYDLTSLNITATDTIAAFYKGDVALYGDIQDSAGYLDLTNQIQAVAESFSYPNFIKTYKLIRTGKYYQQKFVLTKQGSELLSTTTRTFSDYEGLRVDPFGDQSCKLFLTFENEIRELVTNTVYETNGEFISGILGQGFNPKGNLTHVSFLLNSPYTITFWIRPSTGYDNIHIDLGNVLINLFDTTRLEVSGTTVTVNSNNFNFIVVKIYPDSKEVFSYDISGNQISSSSSSTSTNNNNITKLDFSEYGLIDHFRIFNRDLTDDEIQYLIQEIQQ